MDEVFSLQIEFRKEKLGIHVEELVVEHKDDGEVDDDKSEDKKLGTPNSEYDKTDDECEKAATAVQIQEEESHEVTEKKVNSIDEIEDKYETIETASENLKMKTKDRACELLITSISDEELTNKGLVEYTVIRKINNVVLKGMSFSEQLNILRTTKKPFTLTFTGQNYLNRQPVLTTAYSSILKELVAEGDSVVQSIFCDMVKGSAVEKELKSSREDRAASMRVLLSNRGRLLTLLQNLTEHEE